MPRSSASQTRCQRLRAIPAGRKSGSNWAARLGSSVPRIAPSGISRMPGAADGAAHVHAQLVEHGQPPAFRGLPADQPQQRGAPPGTAHAGERPLCIDEVGSRSEHASMIDLRRPFYIGQMERIWPYVRPAGLTCGRVTTARPG